MRQMLFSLAVLTVSALSAAAADLNGEWLVEDGSARIRLADCNGGMWGIVAWARQRGVDSHNPDPSQRRRSTLGLPIIRGMRQVRANQWEGPIYNPENGETYDGKIIVQGPNVLEVEGCILGGWFCGGQKWTRVPSSHSSVGAMQTADLCSAVLGTSRAPH